MARLVVARGLAPPSRVQELLALRRRGDPRPLAQLLIDARVVTREQVAAALAGSSPASSAGSSPGRELEPGAALLLRPDLEVRVERVLGRGGMGVVYLVTDLRLGRQAALKLIRGERAPARAARFRRETVVTARLAHPGIPPVFDAGCAPDGQDFLLMRFVEGEALTARIERLLRRPGGIGPGAAAARDLLDALVRVCEAVAHAHGRGIVHRDLKPDNVMLGALGEVFVMDWGLARDLRESALDDERLRLALGVGAAPAAGLTQDGAILGTLGYMAPEQAKGIDVGPPADVFALGALLSAALTGRPPFDATQALELLEETLQGRAVTPRRRDRRVPPELDAIAAACLQREPARRPTAADVARELRAWLGGQRISLHRYRVWEQTWRVVRGHPTLFTALLLGFALTLGGVVAVGRARQAERLALVARARLEAEAHAARLTDLPPDLDALPRAERRRLLADRTGQALDALTAAQRWLALAPDEAPAREACFGAALALGDAARRDAQWTLAARAFTAGRVGLDDAAVDAALLDLEEARSADSRRRREVVLDLLARAERNALSARPDGVQDAAFEVVRVADADTVELLAARLHTVVDGLLAAEREVLEEAAAPTDVEAALGGRPLEGLAAAVDAHVMALRAGRDPGGLDAGDQELIAAAKVRLARRTMRPLAVDAVFVELVAARQRERLGAGALEAAQLCCEALGRLEATDRATAALAAYVRTEADPQRAAVAGAALCRLGTPVALAALRPPMRRFGESSSFARRMRAMQGGLELGERLAAVPDLGALERGVELLGAGDASGALRVLDEALAAHPEHAELLVNRGNALLALGRLFEAEASFERAIAAAPTLMQAWAGRAAARLRQGRRELALEDLDRAVVLSPTTPELYHNRANARSAAGDVEGALADLDRAIDLAPGAGALVNRGVLRARRGRHEEALQDYARALELDPAMAHAYMNRGSLFIDRGELSRAQADLERAVALDPRLATGWFNLGVVRQAQGQDDAAIHDLTRAIELRPDLARAWSGRGLSRHRAGQLDGAAADYDRALTLEESATTRLCRAALRQARGELAGAREDLEAILARSPDALDARVRLAEVHLELGEHDAAAAHLEAALEREPGAPRAWYLRARRHAALGQVEAARRDAARLVELAGDDLDAATDAAHLLLSLDDPAAAQATAERALRRRPDHPGALAALAVARALRGDLPGAVDAARRAGAGAPHLPFVWWCVTTVLVASGDLEGGATAAGRLIELQPGRPDAHEWLGHVRALQGDAARARDAFARAAALGANAAASWAEVLAGAAPGPAPAEPFAAAAARFLRGEVDERALLDAARAGPSPWLLEPRARLLVGLAAERRGDVAAARASYEAIMKAGQVLDHAYHHAARRLGR
ncbi:MAG: tetratricopeptide repeat protein [Planctomycetes bacterium]|nr:tetratricopeptide repeat protein [Planctomycetota bacterium]